MRLLIRQTAALKKWLKQIMGMWRYPFWISFQKRWRLSRATLQDTTFLPTKSISGQISML